MFRRMLRGLARAAWLCAALAATPPSALAAGTTSYSITSTTFIDLGPAPVQVQTRGGAPVAIVVADTQPTVGAAGVNLLPGPPVIFEPADAASHVWAAYLGASSNVAVTPIYSTAGSGGGAATQSGIWQVTPTLTAPSVLTRPANATAYTTGQLIASSATAGSIVNPSFAMPALGGAIPRLRLNSNDTTSTAWASASIQIDLWSAAPTWTNGDHGTWLPATGSASHLASYTCAFPSAVWGDGLATECAINQGNYASIVATTVYWSAQALSGSGVLSAGAATLTLRAELN